MKAGKSCLAAVLFIGTAGCASAPVTTELLSPPPQNYHEIVAARIGPAYYEAIVPAEAEISNPLAGQSQLGASSLVCVRAPKEKGPKSEKNIIALTFRAGAIVDVDYYLAYYPCLRANYKPFPELQAHYKPPAPGTTLPARVLPNAQRA